MPKNRNVKKSTQSITDKEPAMKFRKLKTRGFAATRAKLGLSQRQLAEQLGISKATISMAESGRRNLPTAALLKIAALEIKMAAAMETSPVNETEKSNMDLPAEAIPGFNKLREAHCHEQLHKLTGKLEAMTTLHKKLHTQLLLLDRILEKEPEEPGNSFIKPLQIQRSNIVMKMSRCSLKEQGRLRNRIALLNAETHMNRSQS